MHKITYRRLLSEDDKEIPQLISIYQLPEIKRYISISDNYFHYVTSNETVCFYKVYACNRMIGAIHIEKRGVVLFMDILVFPEFQGKGLGTKILKDIQNDVFGLDFERIDVSIDEENTASLRLFQNAGFLPTSKEDELINFVYRKEVV